MSTPKATATAAAMLVASIALSGCVVTPVGPRLYVGATVAVAPPPLRTEIIGVAPGRGYIWTGGYWGWAGGRYQWVGGRWVHERRGYRWARSHWVRGPGGWHRTEGRWERR